MNGKLPRGGVLTRPRRRKRKGAITVLAAVCMVAMLAMIAFSLDLGYICLVRSQTQSAADSAALAAASCVASDSGESTALAREFAGYNKVAGTPVATESVTVDFGTWDNAGRLFTVTETPGNAVRVTVRRDAAHGGNIPLFFANIFGIAHTSTSASAVAMTNPRDIAFVVDLSGSMNNDTEPCWATSEIDNQYGPRGYPTVAADLMQQLYDDFNFGTFPGDLQCVGQPLLSLSADNWGFAYAELTKNSGPLTPASINAAYRIANTDSEATRKTKAYKWIIDNQIPALMPNAKPTPNSGDASSLAYWQKYLDYVLESKQIKSTSSYGKPRPSYPVTLPPNQSGDRISGFGNPYGDAYPDADANTPLTYRNKIGYRTLVQFMMDYGRDVKPVTGVYVPLSKHSPDCPWHSEVTDGGTFSFPPREQPTHAARRALIAAIQVIKSRNQGISDPNQCDKVSLITFDRTSGTSVVTSLTADYDAAMLACASLQATADNASSTATETGLIAARNHIKPVNQGGQGRNYANKVVVLLTDGIPNLHSTSDSELSQYINDHPNDDFYSSGETHKNAALMQAMSMQSSKWFTFAVGIGLGTDYEFMDRTARLGNTANKDGEAPRGEGNPAMYEQRLKDIFTNIITNPKARLVQ